MEVWGGPSDILVQVIGKSMFVLLVDDDAAFAYAAARHLNGAGTRTIASLDSFPSPDALESNAIDVFITDIKHPLGNSDSSTLARLLRDKRPRGPVILMTAFAERFDEKAALPGAVVCEPVGFLILLCHRFRRMFRGDLRAQHGQRDSIRAIATTIAQMIVAIEFGTWRWGGAAGSVTGGNGRFREHPGGTWR
jgi:CheY-like chemotaxis protein